MASSMESTSLPSTIMSWRTASTTSFRRRGICVFLSPSAESMQESFSASGNPS